MIPIQRWSLWQSTLFRYLLGPTVAIVLMSILVVRFAGLEGKNWFEDSTIYQTNPEGAYWQKFSAAKLSSFRDQDQIVLVHFVANWNPLSLQNRVALCSSPRLNDLFEKYHVQRLLADASTQVGPTMEALHEMGEDEFPLIALYKPGQDKPAIFRGPLNENDLAAEIVRPTTKP